MAENDSDTIDETPEDEGSEGTPEQTASDETDQLALARKRHAGAEAARQREKARADALEAELAPLRTASQTQAQKDMTELAQAQARADAAEKRAQEAESKAQATLLDKLYPDARAKYPEITDEARLAELQVFYGSDAGGSSRGPGTPLKHNNEKSTGGSTEKKEETAEEVKARLLAMPSPF